MEHTTKSIKFTLSNYLSAKANGETKRFEGDEISYRISLRHPISYQISLLFDQESEKLEAYLTFRELVKFTVRSEIEAFEREAANGVHNIQDT